MNSGRQSVELSLGKGFNPNAKAHIDKALTAVEERHGEGFRLEFFDAATGRATFTRSVAAAEVSDSTDGTVKMLRIPGDPKISDGDKYAATFADLYPGYVLTNFQPHLNRAYIQVMDKECQRVREAVAQALRVKEWEVGISRRTSGGFVLRLPARYQHSRDLEKLEEIAETVAGAEGWYVKVNVAELSAEMIPSLPPTFPAMAKTPLVKRKPVFDHKDKSLFKVPLGLAQQQPGQKDFHEFVIDLDAAQHMQMGGTTGSGKSVTINCYISQLLSRGFKLAVLDLPTKAADFQWCKRYVSPGWWGCDGPAEAATVTELLLAEGERRSKLFKQHGVTQWKELPPEHAVEPILIVLDEATGMFTKDAIPTATKDSPQRAHDLKAEAVAQNFHVDLLRTGVNRIAAELRFTGMFLLLATQVASASTGIDPKLRSNLPHKMMMGSRPTKQQMGLIFSDLDRIPPIPESIISDPDASRGVGVADPEGGVPTVFKSYFRTISEYQVYLESLGVQTYPESGAAPTRAQVAQVTGEEVLDEYELERQATAHRRATMGDPVASIPGLEGAAVDENGRPLKGAALAAAQSRILAQQLSD